MAIEIIIDGTSQTVTKQELFRLVTSGKISADTPVLDIGTERHLIVQWRRGMVALIPEKQVRK